MWAFGDGAQTNDFKLRKFDGGCLLPRPPRGFSSQTPCCTNFFEAERAAQRRLRARRALTTSHQRWHDCRYGASRLHRGQPTPKYGHTVNVEEAD
eukprot:scaffold57187_cov70-Phaeocystis_antarctica.AAC.4